jgi:hypothetical protein
VGWTGEAINAAVLAAAIRIYARLEPDIRAVVPRNDCLCLVAKKLGLAPGLRFLVTGRIDLNDVFVAEINVKLFESISRTPRRAASMDRRQGRGRFVYERNKLAFLARRHATSSHEHIALSRLFFRFGNRKSAIEIRKFTAEGVGFEPTRACALPVFKTGAINHSTTPPKVWRARSVPWAESRASEW